MNLSTLLSARRCAPLLGLHALLLLPACTPIATVKMREPVYRPANGAPSIAEGRKYQKSNPRRALGEYLEAVLQADHALKARPHDDTARKDYNYAVARCVEAMDKADISGSGPVTVPSDSGDFLVTAKLPRQFQGRLREFRLYAADTVTAGGAYFKDHATVDGLGAPFAAVAKEENKDYKKNFEFKKQFGAATALIRFSGPNQHRAEMEFLLPMEEDYVTFNGTRYPLAADFSAPLAIIMVEQRPERLGLRRLLRPEKYKDTAMLGRLQVYDPNRIPVLFVHGLQDTPASWAPMVNELRKDPEIREHYQFWAFSYPSGYPFPYSASLLREELDRVDKTYPGHKPIVLVGHSMGGLVSRLMITDAGDKIWRAYFGKSPEKTHLAGASRDLLEKSIIFNHRADISRVIFISTPHKGSNLATIWIGRIGSALVHAPKFIADMKDTVLAITTVDRSAMKMSRMPNSIDTLAPNNRFVLEMNKMPFAKGIPYHSIIGDRGRGDSPNSSDGVVPYWSSHLDGAQSEKIVPSGHGAPRNPVAMEEVKRILKLHLHSR